MTGEQRQGLGLHARGPWPGRRTWVAMLGLAMLAPFAAAGRAVAGELPSPVPRCFGAAARDPAHQPCVNPRLTLSVVPKPSDAELETGDNCRNQQQVENSWMCSFGPSHAILPFALVGDSHAGHWRPALSRVASAFGWNGVSITRAGCPFSTSVPFLTPTLRASCADWRQRVISWFTSHPEVNIVFFSEHAGARILGADNVVLKGRAAFATRVAGYISAWSALPPSVKHIIVIRDTPLNRTGSLVCVQRAVARHLQAGRSCAVRRSFALKPDPEVAAATQLHSPRVQVLDLTPFFCDNRLCFPVIGGVLVHKDPDHLTTEFSATLGRFLLAKFEQLRAVLESWGSATTTRTRRPSTR